jgi:hypothetical protein
MVRLCQSAVQRNPIRPFAFRSTTLAD